MMRLFSLIMMGGLSLALIGCPSDNPDDCPSGICFDAATDTPPDAPIGCQEAWVCTPWETNGADDNGTRTCTDQNNCGTTNLKPVESAVLPGLDYNYYQCQVEPVFDLKCGQLACHGTEEERALRIYSRGRLRITGETWIEPGCLSAGTPKPSENCIGSIECYCWTLPHSENEWRRNYDSARGFALDNNGNQIPAGMEDTSELLIQPVVGGRPHTGIHVFRQGDADYDAIRMWLGGASLPNCDTMNN